MERSRWIVIVAAVAVVAVALGLSFVRRAPPPAPKAAVRELSPDPIHAEADDGYVPPKPADSNLAPLLNRKLPERQRLSPDMASRFTQINYEEDLPLLLATLKDPKDADNVRNEIANYLRRAKYPGLADTLMEVLDNPVEEDRFRAFAAQHLWELPKTLPEEQRTKIMAKLHSLLNDRHVAVRREVLWGLVCLKDPVGIQTATQWLESEDASADQIRDLTIRCAQEKLNLREKIPVVRKYLDDKNEVVRIAAIVALSQWGDEESRPAFEAAAASRYLRIKSAGEVAILRLDQLKKNQASTQGVKP